MTAKPIPIGHANGRPVQLGVERRSTHMHVMGASGQGKTRFLEHCIRRDIIAGHGVCVIDPEGDLYERVVSWMARERIHETLFKRRVHLFDPSNPDWRFRFNPLFVHEDEKPRHRIDNVIEALAQVWGGEDSRNTPAIRTTIRAIFTVLVKHGYSLAEAFYLTSTKDQHQIVEYLSHDIDDPIIDEVWSGYRNMMGKQGGREHQIEFGGSRRRFMELLGDAEIRETLSAYEDPIDLKQCMDNGDIVLVNLSPEGMGDDPARAFGAMLVRELFYTSSRRVPSEAQQKPFFVYIDECAEYLTTDITRILARSRKRGLHVILAHQWLGQLREQSEAIYQGVMGIQNKVIFGGISDEDAVILADQLFRTEYDLEIPVAALNRPMVVGYQKIWLNNWSRGESDTEGHSETTMVGQVASSVVGQSIGQSIAQNYDEDGFPMGTYTVTQATGDSTVDITGTITAEAASRSWAKTISEMQGASESLAPILKEMVTSVHGLENVRHMAIKRLREIPQRNAVIKGSAIPAFDIRTYDVSDVEVSPTLLEQFTESVFSSSPFTIPTEDAKQILDSRQGQLFKLAQLGRSGFEPVPFDDPDNEDEDGLG